jgi:two-component system OmpR family sensor kinase
VETGALWTGAAAAAAVLLACGVALYVTWRLERSVRGLARSAERMSHFAGNVAHEFRNPLTAMLADVQLAKQESLDAEQQRQLLERMESELRRMGQLIESFLLMTRIESGEQRRDLVHLDDVARRVHSRCLPAAERGDVRLELHCRETDARRAPIVTGDAELLQSLVENLVRNAIRHSPPGAPVTIDTARVDDVAQVVVRDRGPGIADEVRDLIFRRGVAAPAMPSVENGHGLGLSIALSVAQMHGGTLELQRNEGGGSAFVVALPLAREASSPGQPESLRD